MKTENLKVKNLTSFMDEHKVLYASMGDKRLFVTLRSGPNVLRYIVVIGEKEKGFTKKGDAVRCFNEGII